MKTRLLALAVVAAALVCFLTPQAPAGDCGYGYGFGYGLGYLYQSLDYNVPYFAAHPPVYYSYPVPRTYGYSPFAYPPNVMTPEVVEQAKPVQIVNPYVPKAQSTQQEPAKDRSAKVGHQSQPLVILNPYFKPTQSVAQSY
jgi:hypothetical protein